MSCRPGFLLPPLMFSEEEIEALVLGSRWVAERGDDEARRRRAQRAGQDRGRAAGGSARRALELSSPADRPRRTDRGRRTRARPHPRRRSAPSASCAIAYRDAPERASRSASSGRSRWPSSIASRVVVGVVRVARGFSPFPHRPHRGIRADCETLSPPPAGAAQGVEAR